MAEQTESSGLSKVPLKALLFGGCLVHWPITRTKCAEGRLEYLGYGPIKEVHTFSEMFQIIEILRGQKTVPLEVSSLSRMCALSPVAAASDFADIDIALIEPASPIELTIDGTAVNRIAITVQVLQPLAAQSGEAAKLGAAWLRQGLVGMNEAVRAETAAKLLEFVQGETPSDELARLVIRETRAARQDTVDGFRKMREMLGCAIGVVVYVFRYMPDGRAISWPAGFREEVLSAAQQLDLPIFDPTPHVLKRGVQKALRSDLGHYDEEFMPVIGEALVEFAESVYAASRAPARKRTQYRSEALSA